MVSHATRILQVGPWDPNSKVLLSLNSLVVEATWKLGNWETLDDLINLPNDGRFEVQLGKTFADMHGNQQSSFAAHMNEALDCVLRQMTTTYLVPGESYNAYQKAYDCILQLQILHDVEETGYALLGEESNRFVSQSDWKSRFANTLPSFSAREALLDSRRSILDLGQRNKNISALIDVRELGELWILTSKFARKSGYFQIAENAIMHAENLGLDYALIERAKNLHQQKHEAEALAELHRLQRRLSTAPLAGRSESPIGTGTSRQRDLHDKNYLRAKILLLQGKWIEEAGTTDLESVHKRYVEATTIFPR